MRRVTFPAAIFLLVILASHTFPFGKNRINLEPARWKTLRTLHFTVYYPAGFEELAANAAGIIESGYLRVAEYLGHELTRTVPVIIYASRSDFQNNNILPGLTGENIGGFTEPVGNRIAVPYTGSFREFRHVLVHELVHAFQFNMLYWDDTGRRRLCVLPPRIPLWFTEGMAEYLSLGYDEGTDSFMRDAVLNDRFAGLADLGARSVRSSYVLYKEGQAFFLFFENNYGRRAIGEVFRDLRDIGGFEDVMKVHTGKTLSGLDDQWKMYLKRRYYPLVTLAKSDSEDGERLTDHEQTGASFNLYPAVSPDGARIAYLTNRDVYVTLVIADIGKEKRIERTVLKGNSSAGFEDMLVRINSLSWSADGTRIALIAQRNGRDTIYLVNPVNGDILQRVTPNLREIMDPSLSPDGKSVVFSGVDRFHSDIYIHTFQKMKTMRVTADDKTDRFPRFSPDGKSIVYCARDEGPESGRDDYDIVRHNLDTGESRILAGTPENEVHPDLSPDGEHLLFASNRSGIYNIFSLRLEDGTRERLTDTFTGVYNPRWVPGSEKIVYVAYQRLGYDVYIKDLAVSEPYPPDREPGISYFPALFPPVRLVPEAGDYGEYGIEAVPDRFVAGFQGALRYGFAGFVGMGVSDFTGDHRINATFNYFRVEGRSDYNADLTYLFLRYRWDFAAGVFYQENPLFLFSDEDVNDLEDSVNFGTADMRRYGGRLAALYPFTRYFRLVMGASSGRYEAEYPSTTLRSDVAGGLHRFTVSMVFDNVLWRYQKPIHGFRWKATLDQSVPLTGSDIVCTSVNMDLRIYIRLSMNSTAALRFAGGAITGPDSGDFEYYIGGHNTLRGFDLFSEHGTFMFLAAVEYRFTLFDDIRMGWPFSFSFGEFGGVLFADAGSAWKGRYVPYSRSSGRLRDLKLDIGAGIRYAIYPLTILKLDFAWPYDTKTFGKMVCIFSLGMEF